ncbi:MAG: tRNA (adenosine(37)-N6)-dimethylallyltransferase MiaA [Victivallales bacterium]|nr:tRNA (adenosine(37)-N6)-dimethylallyltransferase MiaA [Victivallales bacterium]
MKAKACQVAIMENKRCLVVTGPTASGKTHLAVALARCFGCEIVSADSRQVFRGLDIGTGKDLAEYSTGGKAVPYHLIDVVEPTEDFNLFVYLRFAKTALEDIWGRGLLPLVCGGTPLYIKALLDGYDQEGGAPDMAFRKEMERKSPEELLSMLEKSASPRLFERTDKTQTRRIVRALELALNGCTVEPVPFMDDALVIAPYFTRGELHSRIEARLDARLKAGLLDEARRLNENGLTLERMEWLGLEYRFAARVLAGKLSEADMRNELLAHIRQFCKRQDGWFRKLERDGRNIYWIPRGDYDKAASLVSRWIAGEKLPSPELRLDDIRY